MTWNPTNANDVTLIISQVQRNDDGTRVGANDIGSTLAIVVDDFSIDTAEDLEGLSGVGQRTPQGISRGDIEHEFSFTVQGEDADLFNGLTKKGDSGNQTAAELEIIVKMEDYKDTLTGAFAGTRNLSGSSGDPMEYEASGMATGRNPGTVVE